MEITVGASNIEVTQGSKTTSLSLSGTTQSGVLGSNITLGNSFASGYGNQTVISMADLRNSDGIVLAAFYPYLITEATYPEVVFINTLGLTPQEILDIVQYGDDSIRPDRIHRAQQGYFQQVTREEDLTI